MTIKTRQYPMDKDIVTDKGHWHEKDSRKAERMISTVNQFRSIQAEQAAKTNQTTVTNSQSIRVPGRPSFPPLDARSAESKDWRSRSGEYHLLPAATSGPFQQSRPAPTMANQLRPNSWANAYKSQQQQQQHQMMQQHQQIYRQATGVNSSWKKSPVRILQRNAANIAAQQQHYVLSTTPASEFASEAKTYFLAIDIETSGPSMVHHFMPCFGAAFIDVETCTVLETRLFWIAQPENTSWDPETVRSFWNTTENSAWYREVVEQQSSRRLPSLASTMNKFVDWVQNGLYAKYAEPHRAHNNVIQIVSDHSSFDLGWLSYYLALGTEGRVPHVQYLLNNKFSGHPLDTRSFCDGVRNKLHGPSFTRSARFEQPKTVTQLLGVSQWKRNLLSSLGVRYDHNPEHDAIVIGINAAVVACALADRLRCEKKTHEQFAVYDRNEDDIECSGSSQNSSQTGSPTSANSSPMMMTASDPNNRQQFQNDMMTPIYVPSTELYYGQQCCSNSSSSSTTAQSGEKTNANIEKSHLSAAVGGALNEFRYFVSDKI